MEDKGRTSLVKARHNRTEGAECPSKMIVIDSDQTPSYPGQTECPKKHVARAAVPKNAGKTSQQGRTDKKDSTREQEIPKIAAEQTSGASTAQTKPSGSSASGTVAKRYKIPQNFHDAIEKHAVAPEQLREVARHVHLLPQDYFFGVKRCRILEKLPFNLFQIAMAPNTNQKHDRKIGRYLYRHMTSVRSVVDHG